jgi:hypothetical protein
VTRWYAAFAAAAGLAGLAVFYRVTLTSGGDLVPGSEIDTRFNLALMEHWFRVVTFKESPLDLRFFHPLTGILGMSDAMVLFAVPYIPMRLFGLDPFTAFRNTLMCVSAIGYVGSVLFLWRTLRLHPLPAVSLSTIFAFSSHLSMTMFHPQMLAVAFLPWLAIALWERRGATFIVLLTLTALTTGPVAWAAGLWIVLAALVALLLYSFRDGMDASLRRVMTLRISPKLAAVTLLCALALASVYASLSVHRTPSPWAAVRPSLGREFVAFTGASIVFCWLAGTAWATVAFFRKAGSAAIAVMGLSSLLGIALASEYPGSFQAWEYVHAFAPGGTLFRVPFRFIIVLTFGVCVTAAVFLSRLLERGEWIPRPAAWLIVVALSLNGMRAQIRSTGVTFSIRDQLERLHAVPAPPERCRVFYAFVPEDPMAGSAAQIDAMLLAQHLGLATMNGYSAEAPRGWNLTGGPGADKRVAAWIEKHGLTGACLYEPSTRTWTAVR